MSTPIYDTLQHARATDPITSHAAATVATGSTACEDVHLILKEHGPLHDAAIEIIHAAYVRAGLMAAKSGQRLRTARAELVRSGTVRRRLEHGHTRYVEMPSGFASTVWEATDG